MASETEKKKHPPRLAAEALSFSRVRWASQSGEKTEGGEVSMQPREVLDVFSLYTFTCVILQYVGNLGDHPSSLHNCFKGRFASQYVGKLLSLVYVHGGSSSPRLLM